MSGFHKSKGIVIELTALLDVIFIMLFWMIVNVQDSGEAVKADAESRIEAAEAQTAKEQQAREELESLVEQKDKEIAEAWAFAESIDSTAAADHQALEGYEQGMLMTLNLKYEDSGELYILNNGSELGRSGIGSQEEIYSGIISSLNAAGLDTEDVVLCAMVYDGSKALYKDVKTVTAAVDDVSGIYKNFYCTYINTAR